MSPHSLRFLCPHCLQFGELLYACPGCWEEGGVLRARLNVGNLQACPCCRASLYPEPSQDHLAFCEQCHQVSDARLHHDHRTVAFGALGVASFTWMCEAFGHEAGHGSALRLTNDEARGPYLDGRESFYLLDVSTAAEGVDITGPRHALRHLECLFFSGAGLEPLELGRMVDRFIRQTRLSGGQRRTLEVLIREPSLPPALTSVLRSRLPRLNFGQDGTKGYLRGTTWQAEALSLRREQPRILAAVNGPDFERLLEHLPSDRQRRLHPGVACAEAQGRLTFVVEASRLSRGRLERIAPVQQAAQAVWISDLPQVELLPFLLERLAPRFGRTEAARKRIVLLFGSRHAEAAQLALVRESFPNVRHGISPEAAMAGEATG